VAVNVESMCTLLHARYAEILGQLAGLPSVSVSEGGRSISTASELKAQLDLITQQAAQLGCPIGTINDPACVFTRARP